MKTIVVRLTSLLVLAEFGSAFSPVLVPASRSPSSPLFSIAPTANEFSRPLQTDRILKTNSGKRTRVYRDYTLEIEASQEECEALARRFELKSLASLKANLSLRPPQSRSSNSGGLLTVEVQGTIVAHLTQTCVRTNEDFEVDVEFPVESVVKPMSNTFVFEEQGEDKPAKATKKPTKLRSDRLYNMNDIMELQEVLGRIDEEEDSTVVEDEAVYSLATGSLDVGELVAQTFWLNLDPYPKKPGTGPMEISISG